DIMGVQSGTCVYGKSRRQLRQQRDVRIKHRHAGRITQHNTFFIEREALKVQANQSLKYRRKSVSLYNLSLDVSAIVRCWKVAFNSALIRTEHEAPLNLPFAVCPLRMYSKAILLKSLDVRRVSKFIIVVISTKTFKRGGNVELKR